MILDNREPPLYKASYELTLAITRFVRDCEKQYKMTLGQTLQNRTLLLQAAIYQVNEKTDKVLAIQIALDQAFFIKMLLRLFLDMNLMKLEVNVVLHALLEDVTKQLQGWKKAQKK